MFQDTMRESSVFPLCDNSLGKSLSHVSQNIYFLCLVQRNLIQSAQSSDLHPIQHLQVEPEHQLMLFWLNQCRFVCHVQESSYFWPCITSFNSLYFIKKYTAQYNSFIQPGIAFSCQTFFITQPKFQFHKFHHADRVTINAVIPARLNKRFNGPESV